jgi:parallel beta-helix repeat protein
MGKIGVVILTIITCLFGEVHSSFAKEYYVSKIGKDASTCITSPGPDSSSCRTIMYVVKNNILTGADKVYIQGGTYDEHIVLTTSDQGSSGNYLTFKSYQNDDVTITNSASNDEVMYIFTAGYFTEYIKWDGRGTDSGYHITFDGQDARKNAVHLNRCDHIWLTGINFIRAYSANGLRVAGEWDGNCNGAGAGRCPGRADGTKNSLIEYCKFYKNGDYGVKLTGYGTNNNIFRYCDLYSNGIDGRGSSKYGMNLSGSEYEDNQPNGNIFHHCNFYSNNSSGANIQHCTNTQIYNCKFYSNGAITTSGRGLSLGPDVTGALVFNNEIYDNKYYGLELSNSSSNKIYNNLIYNNGTLSSSVADLIQQDTCDSNKFYNNTVYSNLSGFREPVYIKAGTNTELKNNLFIRNGSGQPIEFNVNALVCNKNNFWKVGGASPIYLDGTSRTVDYLNAKDWADANINEDPVIDASYKLTSSSPQGTGHVRDGALSLSSVFTTDKDGVERPQGAGWDIGAYEFYNVSTIAPPNNLRMIAN